MLYGNIVRKKLSEGGISLGTWIQIGHPAVAEILSECGFDWITIDCEHSEISIEGVSSIVRAMYGRDSLPMVRVKENNTLAIRQVLDMGATGVFVPLVNTAEEARQAVAATRFPPEGIRGFAYYRANDYGKNFQTYAETANEDILVIVMIETRQAVENVEKIVAVPGVDGVLIGPYDLSGSYGIPGQVENPIIRDAGKRVIQACIDSNTAAGIHIVTPDKEKIQNALSDGYRLIALGMDNVFMMIQAQKNLRITKSIIGKLK
ncbi:MAG: 2,4-dihydroxyhept-2-ene-1,7-dioic acid aldolase [Bacteroidetes bacterium]|nr:2,4-dihydroxyhept-2-ene-1,7-dioic acid aldolase [Bacteroidota bacterium]